MIDTLIDRPDNFERVRDNVAQILADEGAGQVSLALAAGVDAEPWLYDVYTERSNPWEQYLNDPSYVTPIVNVSYDSSSFDKSTSNISERQGTLGTFHVDICAVGYSEETDDGHISGDEQAAYAVQRAIRLTRSILMASQYTYLNMRGVVGQRWVESATIYSPNKDANTAQSIIGARLVLMVQFNEFSPQYTPVALENLGVTVTRSSTGQILAQVDFNYGE